MGEDALQLGDARGETATEQASSGPLNGVPRLSETGVTRSYGASPAAEKSRKYGSFGPVRWGLDSGLTKSGGSVFVFLPTKWPRDRGVWRRGMAQQREGQVMDGAAGAALPIGRGRRAKTVLWRHSATPRGNRRAALRTGSLAARSPAQSAEGLAGTSDPRLVATGATGMRRSWRDLHPALDELLQGTGERSVGATASKRSSRAGGQAQTGPARGSCRPGHCPCADGSRTALAGPTSSPARADKTCLGGSAMGRRRRVRARIHAGAERPGRVRRRNGRSASVSPGRARTWPIIREEKE
jgi:hypothetical protein